MFTMAPLSNDTMFNPNVYCLSLFIISFITTAQLHLSEPEFRFCTDSNSARFVSDDCADEKFWQWMRFNSFSLVNYLTKQSEMELFVKIVNDFQPLTILAKSSIFDAWQVSKYSSISTYSMS